MSAAAPSHAFELDNTFGAAYVGAMVTMIMYGITVLQTYFYFITYPKDSRGLKCMVGAIWLLDTFHVALVCQAMYHYLITNFGVPTALADGTWELYVSIGINVVIAFVVQIFFIVRIYRLCGPRSRWWVTGLTGCATLAHCGFGLATVVRFGQIVQFQRLHEIVDNPVTPFAVTAVLSDIFIAGALCVLLWNSRTNFRDTNHIISTLIVWAVNRCLLTSVVAVAETIVFAARPHDFWFIAIDFVIGKLYANSLLATLNARRSMKGRGTDAEASDGTSASTGFQIATAIASGQTSTFPRGIVRQSQTDTEGTNDVIEIELEDKFRRPDK